MGSNPIPGAILPVIVILSYVSSYLGNPVGKTETIKQRAIYVYLPSMEMVERWKELAERQGTSISKFVAEHVENSLRQEEEPGFKSRAELMREIRTIRGELEEERKKNRRLDFVVDKLEEELRRYRAKPFLEEGFEGVRGFQKKLVELLREGGLLGSSEILSKLGIDPREQECVRAVSKQLEVLESYGLVSATSKGWRWVE